MPVSEQKRVCSRALGSGISALAQPNSLWPVTRSNLAKPGATRSSTSHVALICSATQPCSQITGLPTQCRIAQARVRDNAGREGVSVRCVVSNRLQWCMQSCILIAMQSTSVRIDQATHQELKRLADRLGTTVGETVALAVRRLRQDRIGEELTASLRRDEVDWLDADLG